MHKLAEICVKRPVFAAVLVLLPLLFGLFGYSKLGVDLFPKVDLPFISVTTALPGSAPEEIETEITDKIEEAVNTVSGIDELRSVSSEGISQVFISFNLDKNIDVASQEVRDKVNRVLGELPQDVRQPLVQKLDPDAIPVLTIALSGPFSVKEITEYADKVLRRNLESTRGVGQVALIGGQKRQINVDVDPLKLRAFDLTVPEVARAIQTKNAQVPGGTLKEGAKELTVRTLGRVSSVEELGRISVANRNGRDVCVADLGTVADGSEEAESLAQFNDTPAILLEIRKQSGTNTIEVVQSLKERLETLMGTLPQGYHLDVVRDQSVYIQKSVDTVKEHLVIGSLLAAIVVLVFLANARTTLISALAIPTSIISTFSVIYFMGYTLNMLTLLALTLSVGIVIDDAIVVLENTFRYIEEKGYSPREAVLLATKEIGLAVVAITLSLVAVFLPIAFMEGIVGQFMKSFGATMASAIVISMLVSFSLTPMLASRWLRKRANGIGANGIGANGTDEANGKPATVKFEAEHARAASKQRGFYHYIEMGYVGLLRFALGHRWLVVMIAILLVATIPLQLKIVAKDFSPEDDQSEFEMIVRAPEGTSLEATQLIISRVAGDVRQLNGVKYTIGSTANTEQRIANLGNIYIKMNDVHERTFSQMDLMNFIRKNLVPKYQAENLRVSIQPIDMIANNSAVTGLYVVGGPDMKKLEQYANKLADTLKQCPDAVDIDTSLIIGKPQYGVKIDQGKANDLGISTSDIATTIRLLLAGDKVSDFSDKGELYDVYLRASSETRSRADLLQMVAIPTINMRKTVPLRDVVRFEEGVGPAQINRLNRARQVTINANLAPGGSLQAIIDTLDNTAKELNMGPEYKSTLVGKSKEMAKTMKAFLTVFLMGFLFAYLVMAAQFESWLHPITVLMALPLTLPFALISLFIFGQSLNIFSILGILVLFAVVNKNAILQIDHTNQLREAGLPRFDAIIDANLDRLRPILMTTVAFVAGMFPLLLSSGAGAATNKTISSVVIGGQTLSLLLTLIATPVAYSLFDDVSQFFRRLLKRDHASIQAADSKNASDISASE